MKYIPIQGHWPALYARGERLGRYEYVQGTSQKFYHVMMDSTGVFWAFYGRLGSSNPQFRRFQNEGDVARVLAEKQQKGYEFVPGFAATETQAIEQRQKDLDRLLPPAAPETVAPSRRPRM